jgi:hypothetical protein
MEDFVYACIQLMHNVGAAAVVGIPAVAWWRVSSSRVVAELPDKAEASATIRRRMAWLTLLAWSTQIASGITFGLTTYYLKHELPELTGVGFAALAIKIGCAFICCILTLVYLRKGINWVENLQLFTWQTLFALGLAALMSAAFLRWYG